MDNMVPYDFDYQVVDIAFDNRLVTTYLKTALTTSDLISLGLKLFIIILGRHVNNLAQQNSLHSLVLDTFHHNTIFYPFQA